MNDSTDWGLLARFLAGECSGFECEQVQAWMLEDPENQQLMRLLNAAWDSPEIERAGERDIQKLWRETAERAGIAPKTGRSRAPLFASLRARKLVPAAVLLGILAVAIPFLIWRSSAPGRAAGSGLELTTLQVANGQRESLTLSDGTRVMLDAGSMFQYPGEFSEGAREVYLVGEGLFDVAPGSKSPFLIHANGALVRVLGTRFNVRAWRETGRVEVVVSRGRISLSPDEEAAEDVVVIMEGQGSTLIEGRVPDPARAVDVEKYLGWLKREADFRDTPLSEILAQLERWYDIRFVLGNSSIALERLTVHIDSRPLEEILELIATLTDQEVERREENLVFLNPHRLN